MPGVISVSDFLRETREDLSSPTTSNFVTHIPQCRETVNKLEEALSSDRDGLVKLKTSIKDMNKAGTSHTSATQEFSKSLNRISESTFGREEEDDIGVAFQKFAIVTRQLSELMKDLMTSLDNIVMFPVDRLLKTELRGSKGDLKRPFDRSWKDYQDKYVDLERQKKKAAKEAGLHRSELTAGEIADEMEKERKYLQLTTSEYLLRINEIRTKKGADLLQHLIKYYHAQQKYYSEGFQAIEHFGNYIAELSGKLTVIQQVQDDEKTDLMEVRNSLKNSPGLEKLSNRDYSIHQPKGDAAAGNQKTGYLQKRSEGRIRNTWQKRKCQVHDGFLKIFHADESKDPARVNLLTCQMKPSSDDRLCFDVVSYNRTYHFQAEVEADREEWMSVLLNSKDGALNQAFQENGKSNNTNQGFLELQRSLVTFIRGLPGNDKCCDCGSNNDSTWLSTNFGVIICIECSGIHREMGVHISKIQSLTLDNIGTSQLLVSRVMSNDGFNKVMEAAGNKKLNPSSTMDERKSYIKAKYEEKLFVHSYAADQQEIFADLEAAIDAHSLFDLLQVFGEMGSHGIELTDPLPTSEFAETSLHHAISHETGNSLHIVDFVIQNSSSLDKQTREGNTPLHYCVIQNQCESMRLLLRSGANPGMENNNGKTPLSIAKERGHALCEEMLSHALQRKKTMFENVNIDWRMQPDDGSTDFSDDEGLDDRGVPAPGGTPERASNIPAEQRIYGSPPDHFISGSRSLEPMLGRHTPRPKSMDPNQSNERDNTFNNNNNNNLNNKSFNSASEFYQDRRTATSDWSGSTPSENSSDSPATYRIMPPPPPPQNKNKAFSALSGFNLANNMASHMVGSLKKNPKNLSTQISASSPSSTSYNTLPSHRHLRAQQGRTPSPKQYISPTHPNSGMGDGIQATPPIGGGGGISHSHTLGRLRHKRGSPTSGGRNAMSYHPLLLSELDASQQFRGSLGNNVIQKNGSGSKIQHHTVYLHVGSKNGANSGSDASPPMQSFTEESSPENMTGSTPPLGSSMGNGKAIRNFQSTESLDSLSDESGGHAHNKSSSSSRKVKKRKCRALYDCQADNEDELTFEEDDIIIIINPETEDENWMEGYKVTNPTKRGLFPVSFVNMID